MNTYSLDPDRIVFNASPGRAKQHDASIRGIVDHVVTNKAV
jgi:hypothetical protein